MIAPLSLARIRPLGWTTLVLPLLVLALAACQPTVKVEAPDKPITINLNIKLDADVRLRLEDEAKQDIDDNPDIF